tara:strand:+ start:204 stop:752 length:549 start_codon:yes stop_codon:yes gene_type:complete
MFTKNNLRKRFIKIRKKKYFEVKKKYFLPIINLIKKNFRNKTFFLSIYFPINYEVNALNLIKFYKIKKMSSLIPTIKNNKMKFYRWEKGDPLIINKFGIPEPVIKKKEHVPDIILLPLLAYDKDRNRLGYGKGYYDRFLKKYERKKKIITVGLAFSFQKYNKLPTSSFDMSLDYIINEKGLI